MPTDDEFEEMRKIINRMLQDALKGRVSDAKEPFVHGFSIRPGPDGQPQVREIGGGLLKVEAREELDRPFDVLVGDTEVSVTLELPGLAMEDLEIVATDRALSVAASSPRRYYKEVLLPVAVDPSTMATAYNNGVLDVVLRRK